MKRVQPQQRTQCTEAARKSRKSPVRANLDMVLTMLIPFIIVVVVAIALAVLFWLTKNETITLKSHIAQLQETNADQAEEIERKDTKTATLKTRIQSLDEKIAQHEATIKTKNELSHAQSLKIDDLGKEKTLLKDKHAELESQLQEAEKKIVSLATRPDAVFKELATSENHNAATLWQLELARSERAWRHSVATNPLSDESPFEDVKDPTRLAVEVEAAALREDVGTYITIDWQAEPIDDPSRQHLVVRVAQELLAEASRSTTKAKLLVTGSDDLKLEFIPTGEDDDSNLIPPQITNELIDLSQNEGISITVKS